ncbi:catalase-domain-containing protein [Atractiella rhizophila]|nr:catalase-domain-containing protein [Atractiella rhizophila]
MASIGTAIKDAVMDSAKVKDLKREMWDPNEFRGKGVMTTDAGAPIIDTDTWLKVSSGNSVGPALLEDQVAREKIMRFDHERIPERVVHARGTGAHGYFKLHRPIPEYSFAKVLNDTSKTTPVFVRFSTVQGSKGSADTVRDVRGFAVKLYTDEGNWDIVGNNIPVFFIQDAIKFPDIVHAVKPEPHNEVPQGQSAHNSFYDFISLQPETSHMLMWVMSDRAVPRSYRMMQGFGVNTYTLLNAEGKRHFVKFHFTPELGVHSIVWDEAIKISGADPDFHRKDLEEAILNGAPAKWTFSIQVLPEEKEDSFDFDILDATKIWPEDLVPKIDIGELVLDRCVDEFFPETEQVAFCTSHIVPGIGFSNDPLLQGRNFSYFDTQLSRLGANWQELPINRPICPMRNLINRDGAMRHRITTRLTPNYHPNRFDAAPPQTLKHNPEYRERINEGVKARMRGPKFNEHFKQAQLFYNSLSSVEQNHLANALSFELDKCDDSQVLDKMMIKLNNISNKLAREVAEKVGGRIPEKEETPNDGRKTIQLSQMEFIPSEPIIKSRKIAVIIDDGFDEKIYGGIKAAYEGVGAMVIPIGPNRRSVTSASGTTIAPGHYLEGARSFLFDAIIVLPGKDLNKLVKNGRARHWISEAFGHCKVVGAVGDGVTILKNVLPLPQLEYPAEGDDKVSSTYGVVTANKYTAIDAVKELFTGNGFLSVFAKELAKHRNWKREEDGLTSLISF